MALDRRRFVQGVLAMAALFGERTALALVARDEGSELEPWQRGWLEIHHVSTGRGNCVLAIFPDGTTLMIDAGAKAGSGDELATARPDASRRPGEWLGRYARHHLRTTPRREIDTFWATHLHDDHIGAFVADAPLSADGTYRLTGVSDVAEIVPIRRIVDRGWPEYSYPALPTDKSALNYMAFVRSSARRGVKVERIKVGSDRQITLRHEPKAFSSFSVRAIAATGEVWTGEGEATRELFPKLETLARGDYPTENMCSAAVRLDYGSFRYYNGGDLTCDTQFGTELWRDVETAVAKVAGPVSVAALNHHGYYDGTGPDFVRAMWARVWVLQSWHASHPALASLDRLYSPVLYSGPRDVLATSLVEAAELADARLSDKMLSQQGHVVVRVAEGGASYEVIVLDDSVEQGKVKARFGPFVS
jgi:beta-lactamase superfamily II metal-dependent hydrolase